MFNWLNQDILFWTLSTIAQTFGAILALIGALSIFKMQILHNSFRASLSRFREETLAFPGTFIFKTDNELYEYLKDYYANKKYEQKSKENGRYNMVIALEVLYKRLYDIKEHSIPNLKINVIRFSILNIMIILLSLIGLLINNLLSNNISGFLFALITILLCFISLIFSVYIIKYCLSI